MCVCARLQAVFEASKRFHTLPVKKGQQISIMKMARKCLLSAANDETRKTHCKHYIRTEKKKKNEKEVITKKKKKQYQEEMVHL